MNERYPTIRDYHDRALGEQAMRLVLPGLVLTRLVERSGDVRFDRTALHAVVMTLDGSARHLTRMDGIDDRAPSLPGTASLLPAGVAARLAWVNHSLYQRSLMVEFDAGLFARLAPEVMTGHFEAGHLRPGGFAERPVLTAIMGLMGGEFDALSRRGTLFAESLARLLALEIAATAWTLPVRPPVAETRGDPRIRRAIDFVEAHFARDIGLVEIAAAAALSPSQLSVLFRRATGLSPYAYVVDRRLTAAARLLCETEVPIAAIALDCGFADQQHMTRLFRTRRRTTPLALRRTAS